jgi:hypothetical protein
MGDRELSDLVRRRGKKTAAEKEAAAQ